MSTKRPTSSLSSAAVVARPWADVAISEAESPVWDVEAETSWAAAEDCSATAATSETSPEARAASAAICSTAAEMSETREAISSTLAPLHYTLLLWAVVFGVIFFGDVPGPRILIGSAIIVLAGLFIFHRQKVVSEVPEESVKMTVP